MKRRTIVEWVAIGAALAVVGIFFVGGDFISSIVGQSSGEGSSAALGNESSPKQFSDTTELRIEDLVVGKGIPARAGSRVTVHYTGRLLNGTIFDSSLESGTPFQFVLGNGTVIDGWEKGILGMKVGGQRMLVIPPSLAYGERGVPPTIPPNATLIFEVELLGVDG